MTETAGYGGDQRYSLLGSTTIPFNDLGPLLKRI
jgi:hypothetical protein